MLAQHDAIVRRELTRFRGQELKTLGDGFMATFDGPARAVRCASAVVDAVRPLGIEVRSGLHTGEVELTVAMRRGSRSTSLHVSPVLHMAARCGVTNRS